MFQGDYGVLQQYNNWKCYCNLFLNSEFHWLISFQTLSCAPRVERQHELFLNNQTADFVGQLQCNFMNVTSEKLSCARITLGIAS